MKFCREILEIICYVYGENRSLYHLVLEGYIYRDVTDTKDTRTRITIANTVIHA